MCSLILLFNAVLPDAALHHHGEKLSYICILRIMVEALTRMICSNRKRAGAPTGDPVLF